MSPAAFDAVYAAAATPLISPCCFFAADALTSPALIRLFTPPLPCALMLYAWFAAYAAIIC